MNSGSGKNNIIFFVFLVLPFFFLLQRHDSLSVCCFCAKELQLPLFLNRNFVVFFVVILCIYTSCQKLFNKWKKKICLNIRNDFIKVERKFPPPPHFSPLYNCLMDLLSYRQRVFIDIRQNFFQVSFFFYIVSIKI